MSKNTYGMKKNNILLVILSSMSLLTSCSMPNITLHPTYPIKKSHIIGSWILPFNKNDPPLYDSKTHQVIENPDYEKLKFNQDGTFLLEIHTNEKSFIISDKQMRWWIGSAVNTNDNGPAVVLANMRYYPSKLTGVPHIASSDHIFDFIPNNPDELLIKQSNLMSSNSNDLLLCFEDSDVEICFQKEP